MMGQISLPPPHVFEHLVYLTIHSGHGLSILHAPIVEGLGAVHSKSLAATTLPSALTLLHDNACILVPWPHVVEH